MFFWYFPVVGGYISQDFANPSFSISEIQIPKIMFINTSSEYWRGDAALIHVNLENMTDLPDSNAVRRYLFSGAQHVPGYLPLKDVKGLPTRNHLRVSYNYQN